MGRVPDDQYFMHERMRLPQGTVYHETHHVVMNCTAQ